MNNVEEIIKLEGQGFRTQKASSADRWRAAKLIHEELLINSFRDLSEQITLAGGKGSIGHLQRAQRCWQLMIDQGTDGTSPENLPDFSSIYQSPEVRLAKKDLPTHHLPDPEPDDRPAPKPRKRGERPRQGDDDEEQGPRPGSAAGLIAQADQAISKLLEHRAFIQTMTDADIGLLQAIVIKIGLLDDDYAKSH